MPPPEKSRRTQTVQTLLRWVAAVFFVIAGANHFRNPAFYRSITPPAFPAPEFLVAISGACEILGGVALLIRPLRRAAGWGLIALLIAVFPANIYMAASPARFSSLHLSRWLLWMRLPLQGVIITWIWFVALRRSRSTLSYDDSTP
ncbi:MAG TPA: DoxX family membrane protein [Tepidisphaeraceae bacterium]|jgi:uncharacterized membrane protein|nr:DoxX family membrane protein [Tepidisphaeraceae bacterium]